MRGNRPRGKRLVALLAASVVGVAVVQPVAVAAPDPAPVAVVDEAVDEASAQELAKRLGRPVRITGKTSETDEFWATPEGSFTWRQHQRPVRVRRDGGWVAADTTLERRADGTVAPRAAVVGLTLSGGGKGSKARGPLVRMAHNGAEVGLGWETDLPEPVLEGATATYPEVLPGVDLRVTADVVGFSEVLVVKTPEAAKNPKLRKVTFGSHTKNSRVRAVERKAKADSPGLEVVDASGSVVFTGDATRMWDSSGDDRRDPRRAVMGVEVSDGSVSIVPDQAFLEDPNTRYPVFLDPEYSCGACGKAHHVVVQSGAGMTGAKNFDATTGALSDLKAGYQTTDASGTSRSYVQMNTGPLSGKVVDWATLNTTLLYSWWSAPTATSTELHLAGWIDANTTWDNQPGGAVLPGTSRTWLSSVNTTNQSKAPNVPMQFGATDAVRAAAAGGWGLTTFLLKGESESNTSSWRRFGLNPYLEVRYNSTPNNPTDHAMQNGTVPCVKGANRPYVFTRTPQLQARVSDPDGGTLHVLVATSGGPYGADVPGSYHDNAATLSQSTIGTPGPNQAALVQVHVPEGWITSDGIYKWAMRVSDGALSSPRWDWDCEFYVNTTVPLAPSVWATNTPVNQGDTATFGVSVNLATPGMFDIDRFIYTTDGSVPSTQGSPSVPAGRVASTDGRVWAHASLSTTAVNAQQNLIRVRAVNKAGTPGPDGTCTSPLVTVGAAPNAACGYTVLPLTSAKFLKGAWALDDQSGPTAADNVAVLNPGETAHPATLTEAGWNIGYSRGNAWTQADAFGAKDGVKGGINIRPNGYLSTTGPVLDTSKSFSVATWVYLQQNDNWFTVLSQDGNSVSGFFLQYSAGLGKWSLSTKAGDDINSETYRATSVDATAVPMLHAWTHLIGTYDENTRQLSLYVNGKPAGSVVMATPLWNAGGPFVIGAAKWDGSRADHFPGQVDDVQAWQRVLSPQDAHDLATASAPRANLGLAEGAAELLATGATGDEFNPPYAPAPVKTLEGYWKFDENAGTTAADSSNNGAGYANNLITTGASWVPGKSGSALHYNGTETSYSYSTGPAVNTSQSFTVSAWVKLDDLNGYYAVAGQSGVHTPGFAIRYSPDVNAWIFGLNPSDTVDASTQWAYRGNTVASAGVWTLVTGVYNNESKRIQLYVDGKLTASRSFTGTPWNAAGRVTVGGYNFNGPEVGTMRGAIDSVQVWQQALTASQVAALAGLSYVDGVWNLNGHTAGTATGGASLVATDNAANVSLSGAPGTAVILPRPRDFRTDRSYTVSAWVKINADAGGAHTAVSQDDTTNSSFMLGYRRGSGEAQGRWAFAVSCDRTTANCLRTAYSDAAAVPDTWTHLAATLDTVTGKVCLFVNGEPQDGASGCVDATGFHFGAGSLVLGRSLWGGNQVDLWRGGVAGVRVYSGVRTVDQIKGDRTADDPGSLFGLVH
ncbi:LamG domain-containing protein [Saccharothrix carnea]|uniref:LamG domain-containing protein n=1 Tax=Saccharothrix carnea TaxID=1280637 RepID=UPI0011B2917E|nr:LamG domain-containing protein [Saccharothrix carnea]